MKLKLRNALVISYVCLAALLVAGHFIVFNSIFSEQFSQYLKKIQDQSHAHFIGDLQSLIQNKGMPDADTLRRMGEIMIGQGVALKIVNNDGKDVFCMECTDAAKCKVVFGALSSETHGKDAGSDTTYIEKEYPLTHDGKPYGKAILKFSDHYYSAIDLHFLSQINTIFLLVSGALLCIACAIGYAFAAKISRPIRCLTERTEAIEAGDYTPADPCCKYINEISTLSVSVERLAKSLDVQLKAKKQMALDYTHEFRTPLSALQSNLEGMIDGIIEISPEKLEVLRSEVLRLSRMVSQIDNLVALEDSVLLKKEQFDLCVLIHLVAESFDAAFSQKGIRCRLPECQCLIEADKDKIHQVLANIFSNAVKYTEGRGDLIVLVEQTKSTITIQIIDDGIGIAEKDLPHIFEYLYRADSSRAQEAGGYGVGLPVAKAIVKSHGGTIEADSVLDHGTIITVTLPKSCSFVCSRC